MPAPTNDSLPIWSSYWIDEKPTSPWTRCSASTAAVPSVLGRVN
jgi:hypothetical protein